LQTVTGGRAPEARFLAAAHHGHVRKIKSKARIHPFSGVS
jgi:hypothetical protein